LPTEVDELPTDVELALDPSDAAELDASVGMAALASKQAKLATGSRRCVLRGMANPVGVLMDAGILAPGWRRRCRRLGRAA
jgi:hypothetical protein